MINIQVYKYDKCVCDLSPMDDLTSWEMLAESKEMSNGKMPDNNWNTVITVIADFVVRYHVPRTMCRLYSFFSNAEEKEGECH